MSDRARNLFSADVAMGELDARAADSPSLSTSTRSLSHRTPSKNPHLPTHVEFHTDDGSADATREDAAACISRTAAATSAAAPPENGPLVTGAIRVSPDPSIVDNRDLSLSHPEEWPEMSAHKQRMALSLKQAEANKLQFELLTRKAVQTLTSDDPEHRSLRESLKRNPHPTTTIFHVDPSIFEHPSTPATTITIPHPTSTSAPTDTFTRVPSTLVSRAHSTEYHADHEPEPLQHTSDSSDNHQHHHHHRSLSRSSNVKEDDEKLVTGNEHEDSEDVQKKKERLKELAKIDINKGLTDIEVTEKLAQFGHNEIEEKEQSPILKFLSYFTGSIAYLIEAAAILSGALQDWTDFGIIVALLIVNAIIGFLEESRAESAVKALKNTLALQCKAVRNGELKDVPARDLVPGDVISLRLGDIVPADAYLLGVNAAGQAAAAGLQIDQAALTGESLPVTRHKGDLVYSSSIVKQGQMLAVVTSTGERTFVGRAAHLMAISNAPGHFQQLIAKIGNFLIVVTLLFVIIILIVGTTKQGHSFLDELKYALVITIASIPVGLPTVLSVTMAVGAKQLAAKQVIVKKLSAVEQMASLDVLCSDKTGTLTLNQLSLDEPFLMPGFTYDDLLFTAFLASEAGARDAIELCVRETATKQVPQLKGLNTESSIVPGYKILAFQPFDPISKLTRATIVKLADPHSTDETVTGELFVVAKGAPQVIQKLCKSNDPSVDEGISSMASRGLRALGVARSKSIECRITPGQSLSKFDPQFEWELIGMLSLLDPPRPDSKETIENCHEQGLSVKMITGDALLIAKEVAKRLGMFANILHAKVLTNAKNEEDLIRHVERCDGFAQVVPEDKYRVVELLQKAHHLVGMTGDGVNDAPALKKADVGIAVHGCTDAARSAASIVLLREGLSTIIDGIMISRAIYQRMRSYALYRITSTIHFLIFLFLVIVIDDFTIPAVLIVVICLLNDAATLVISVDNVKVSPKPDKWRLGQLLVLSTILGLLLTGASFAHYYIGKLVFNKTTGELGTIMYLQMSSAPHFVIFGTRLAEPFWVKPPSLLFFVAIVGTQIFAMIISAEGVLSDAIGWPWSVSIMAVSVATFFILDAVKVITYRVWNFEMTAKLWPTPWRRAELKRRQLQKERDEIISTRWRKALTIIRYAMKMRHYKPIVREAPKPQPMPSHH